jgi:hypothetical protein
MSAPTTSLPTHVPDAPPPDRLVGWFDVVGVLDEGEFEGRRGVLRRWALRLTHQATGSTVDADSFTATTDAYEPGRPVYGIALSNATSGLHRFRRTPQTFRPEDDR